LICLDVSIYFNSFAISVSIGITITVLVLMLAPHPVYLESM